MFVPLRAGQSNARIPEVGTDNAADVLVAVVVNVSAADELDDDVNVSVVAEGLIDEDDWVAAELECIGHYQLSCCFFVHGTVGILPYPFALLDLDPATPPPTPAPIIITRTSIDTSQKVDVLMPQIFR